MSERIVAYDDYVFRLDWHFACYDMNLLVSVDVESFEQGDLSVFIFLQIYIFLYLKISFGGRGIYNVENVYVTEGGHHVISARRRGADLPPFTSRDLKHLLFSKSRLAKVLATRNSSGAERLLDMLVQAQALCCKPLIGCLHAVAWCSISSQIITISI